VNAPFPLVISAERSPRAAYRRPRGINPLGLLASTGTAAAVISSFALMNAAVTHKRSSTPLIVDLLEMPAAKPKPQEQKKAALPEKRALLQPAAPTPAPAPVVTPVPIVAIAPIEAPKVSIADVPAPARSPAAAPAPTSADNADLSGNLLQAKPPVYPRLSRKLHEQGTVVLSVLVSVAGEVSDVSIARSSGHFRLDRAALAAVRHWRWSPFRQGGETIVVRGNVTIPFVLKS